MSISKRYNPEATEKKWYQHWIDKNYFHSTPDEREAYSIVIPPPNVTGVLHMGHMLNNTIQDSLARKARLDGKNVCWVPGTDHASIATEAKVVQKLRKKGIKKSDLSRDEFMKHAWEWKEEYGGRILEQLKELGASCDWERTRFTMEPKMYDAVIKVFVDLYNKGKIYRGLRIVNWDPEAKTVLSNEEVLYSDEHSKLNYIRYQIEGTDEWLTIATVRPETILGDAAIAVHPKDERYAHLKGKKALIPLINRAIPIIFDDYVEIEFGTGALKVTPAHDPNDYEIGLRHNLEVIDTLNDDGTLNEAATLYIGDDRFVARKKIVKELEEKGHIVKIENYENKVGRSERTGCIVEPKLSLQWFVDMKALAAPALDAVLKEDVEFYPKHFINTYRHWMSNIRDWCISRQLWWGQRVPAWYYGEEVFVAETAEDALAQAQAKHPNLTMDDLRQDEDVVDTWFSSWLWPMTCFDGFENKEELDYYYPTSVLVTGFDIIFFWVARMIMAGYEWEGKKPFKHVYFTGMVRDEKGRKMSKSLGNSPDTRELMDNFGADGVRFGVLSSSPAGGDLLFDDKLCENGRNFCNKMWNALRLVKGWDIVEENPNANSLKVNELAIEWFENRINQALEGINKDFDNYRLSEALMSLYNLIWNEFCSWYLEMVKPVYGEPIDRATYEKTIDIFSRLMTFLHPFMPFITEDIWHHLKERKEGEDCVISSWEKGGTYDDVIVKATATAQDVISKVRLMRNKNGLSPKEALTAFVEEGENAKAFLADERIKAMLLKLGNLASLDFTNTDVESSVNFVAGTEKYFLIIEKQIDVVAERKRLEGELKRAQGFLKGVEKKLGNERFVNNAPAAVIEKERQKMADGQARLKSIQESLAKLG